MMKYSRQIIVWQTEEKHLLMHPEHLPKREDMTFRIYINLTYLTMASLMYVGGPPSRNQGWVRGTKRGSQ
jgi:hypothetical protein